MPVSTSRPAPALFAELYRSLEAEGVDEIVSVHLSGEMSGTFESAQLAALEVELPVHVVDSGQVGIATGYAALTACDVLDAGGTAEQAAEAALARGEARHVAVLRRHAGVPPPRRPDRRRRRDLRQRPVGEAAAARSPTAG